jgi:putative flippase GtrA
MIEFARFFAVTVLGVVIDIAIAFGLASLAGVPLWLAAAIGFALAASANYVLHQTWSFRSGSRSLSAGRAARYAGVALATLGVRVAVVAALANALGPQPGDLLALAILICGAGVSFFVNYALSRALVFREEPA